jgi:hypothetical protein
MGIPSFFHLQHALKVGRSTKNRNSSVSMVIDSPGCDGSQTNVSPGWKLRSRPEMAVIALKGLITL